jgi:glycosyltransferase involved in cell wall biosynthesis
MVKVLHVIPSVSPAMGGPTQVVLNLVKALQECGVEAEIATTNDNGETLLDVPLNQRIEYEGVPVWFLPRFSPPLKEFIFSTAITQWLWQHIRDYDILDNHYLFSYASTCAGAIARFSNVPYTVRTMGQLAPWALAQSRVKKQVYAALIERHNLNRAAAIHCTSNGEVEDVQNFGIRTPTVTLPLGVNQSVYWPQSKQKLREIYGISKDTPIVLFLSRLHYKKRPDLLIESLSHLANQNYPFHLILAGSGEADYLTYLTNLVSSLGIAAQTTFPGFVARQDKDLLLQGSDLFVLPSFAENFGIAVAEAMAAGLPAIITPGIQISPEIAAANAGLVVEGEVEALANAIAHLLTSPQQRQQMGENGKRLVSRRYSWNAIASHLSGVYRSIIDRQILPKHIAFPES